MTPTLRTKNFIIRQFKLTDLEAFSSYRAIPSIAKFQSWTDYSYDDALALFENTDYSNFGVEGNWYQLAITDIHSDTLIGDLAVHFIDEQQVEIGFTISPKFQGKGVGAEAVNGLLDYLFLELKKHRIIAVTDTNNIASFRLLEKSGFRREAHYVKNIFFKGAWGDEYLYAMLSSEYKRLTNS
jgi:RimJ/RimL family protein N-acetyltransferase